MEKLETPNDIPVGTIMVQHWCNSSTFFKVVGTSKKSVLVIKMPSKQTHFDHEGGGTGHSYKLPDEETLNELEAAYKACNKKYGFDVLKGTHEQFETAKSKNESFWDDYFVVSSLCLKELWQSLQKTVGFISLGITKVLGVAQ